MAPEVNEGFEYNLKADVFSLCIIALELFGLKPQKTELKLDTW